MTTYKVEFRSGTAADAIPAMTYTNSGVWRDSVANYDGRGTDLVVIDIDDNDAEDLEEMMERDDRVISYRIVPS